MSAIPGDIDADNQPPMTLPLRHFVVALGVLLAAVLLGLGLWAGILPGLVDLAHVHALLLGWIGITILGAVTQFVPVWSSTTLHSERLANLQLWLVVIGLAGFVASLVLLELTLLAGFGALMLAGFWIFVYNIARTLPPVTRWDVTETHFALALAFFLGATLLGFLLALDYGHPYLVDAGVSRTAVVQSHATLAVFGAVLTTVIGALYQLATMFTQTELHGVDVAVQRFERVAYPAGVLFFAGGRLFEVRLVALTGGLLVIASLLGIAVILARKLHETRVDRTPMLSRYAVLAAMIVLWSALTVPAWLDDPLAHDATLAAPGAFYLLALGVIGFVVLGTLYHIIPFIIWVHRYSDLLGLEPVPMIDDLYSQRVAASDFLCLLAGTVLLAASELFDLGAGVSVVGGVVTLVGAGLFVANMLLVIRDHSPHSLGVILGIDRGGTAASGIQDAETEE